MTKQTGDPFPLSRATRLRLIWLFSGAFVIYLGADIFELPGLRADFQADPTVLGVIVGAILALAGIEVLSRLPGFTSTPRRPPEESDDAGR